MRPPLFPTLAKISKFVFHFPIVSRVLLLCIQNERVSTKTKLYFFLFSEWPAVESQIRRYPAAGESQILSVDEPI